jgi:hypothetical protein
VFTIAVTTGPVAPFLVEIGILVAALAAVARLASLRGGRAHAIVDALRGWRPLHDRRRTTAS